MIRPYPDCGPGEDGHRWTPASVCSGPAGNNAPLPTVRKQVARSRLFVVRRAPVGNETGRRKCSETGRRDARHKFGRKVSRNGAGAYIQYQPRRANQFKWCQ